MSQDGSFSEKGDTCSGVGQRVGQEFERDEEVGGGGCVGGCGR